MRLNIAGGHALGVHGQDFLLDVLTDAGLVLFQHLGFKFSLAISRNLHIHIPEAGAQRFAAVAVAAVVCVFILVVVFAVAQLVIQFCLQAILHEFCNGLLKQILDVIHAADVCHLQQLTDLFSPGIFFRGAIFSGHMVILLCGASILHHAGGLHKTWDSLKKDAIKLANYGLDHWLTLPRYVPEEDTRLMLKTCYRQYQQYSKVQTMLKNNLISLLDTTFPDANRLFTSPPRTDGSEKWVDFVAAFWHCECVCGLSEKAFAAKYQKWCRKHGYHFSEDKALDIYASACGHFGVMPKTDTAKLLVEQAIFQLRATSAALAALKQEMQSLEASLPEYPVMMEMFGVGPTLGPQLMAEIGDVRRFHSKKALVAFAGIDAPPYQSGQMDVRSRSISKRGSAALRRTLFLVMGVYLQSAPMGEPVYQFMDKKRSEGKPYRVYMMASANKFLRIYYASVTAYLNTQTQA